MKPAGLTQIKSPLALNNKGASRRLSIQKLRLASSEMKNDDNKSDSVVSNDQTFDKNVSPMKFSSNVINEEEEDFESDLPSNLKEEMSEQQDTWTRGEVVDYDHSYI